MVGWWHDVVEDTGVTLDDLREDFPEEIVTGADAMTRRQGGETSTTGVWPLIPWRVPWNRRIGTTSTDPARTALLDEETRARLARKHTHSRGRARGGVTPPARRRTPTA